MERIEPIALRIREAAVLLGISRSKAYALVQSGELPVLRIGGSLRVNRRRLIEMVEAGTTGGRADEPEG